MSLGPVNSTNIVGPPGTSDMIIGDPVVGGTDGSILFVDGGNLTQDNANLFYDNTANAVGIGTNTPDASAILDLTSTTQGFLPPRMTTLERDAIATPATGLTIYNTDNGDLEIFDGASWVSGVASDLVSVTLATGSGATAATVLDSTGVFFDIPLSDANPHNWTFGFAGDAILDIYATGDGVGSYVNPGVVVNGKLTVTGTIDPTDIIFSGTATIDPTKYQMGISGAGTNPFFIQTPSDSTAGNSGKDIEVLTGDGAPADNVFTGGLGGHINLTGGVGGVASATLGGGTGGIVNLTGGDGGDGTAGAPAGGGADVNLFGGNPGADGGGGPGTYGSVILGTQNGVEFHVVSSGISSLIPDNSSTAFSIAQSTDVYIGVDTTDSSEMINFGNTTTNPISNFLSTTGVIISGHLSVGGDTVGFLAPSLISYFAETFTIAGSGFVEGIIAQVGLNPSGPTTYEALAGDFEIITTGAEDFTKIVGVYANSNHASTGQLVGSLVGLESEVFLDTGCGNAALAIGGSFFVENNSTATLTDSQAVLIKSTVNSGGGTTTNVYGLFIEDQSGIGSTISYNILSAGSSSLNKFEGSADIKGHLNVGAIGLLSTGLIVNAIDTFTPATAPESAAVAYNGVMILDPVANATYTGVGGSLLVTTASGNSFDIPSLVGVYGVANHNGTGTISSQVGVRSDRSNLSTGTITSSAGVYIRELINSGGGNVVSNIGLHIEDHSTVGSTIAYNLFSAGSASQNIFEGHVAVGPDSYATSDTVLFVQEEFTTVAPSFVEGTVSYINLNPSGPLTYLAYAGDFQALTIPGNVQDFPTVVGVYAAAAHTGNGNITGGLVGINTAAAVNSPGSVAQAIGIYPEIKNEGVGTITSAYGVYIPAATNIGGGAITDNYGLYIEDHSGVGSTNAVNILSLGANSLNYFVGNVRVDGIYLGSSGSAAASNDYAFTANQMLVSGNTTINAIVTPATITAGTSLTLIFSGTPTVKHNTAGGAGTKKIFLAGGVDLTTAANFVLGLVYDGTQWQETFRKSPT